MSTKRRCCENWSWRRLTARRARSASTSSSTRVRSATCCCTPWNARCIGGSKRRSRWRASRSLLEQAVERLAHRVVVTEASRREAHRGQERAEPQHDHGEAQAREQQEVLHVVAGAAGELRPAGDRLLARRKARQSRDTGARRERLVAEQPPPQIDARITDRDHLP